MNNIVPPVVSIVRCASGMIKAVHPPPVKKSERRKGKSRTILTCNYHHVCKVLEPIASSDASDFSLFTVLFNDQTLKFPVGRSKDKFDTSLFAQEPRISASL